MSEFDAGIAYFLRGIVLPTLAVLLVLGYLWRHYNQLQKRLFATYYTKLSATHIRALEPSKEELFAQLSDFRSLDPETRNLGHIRLLELGVGPGTNLRYYPKNTRFTAVEPNANFRAEIEANCAGASHVHLERVLNASGEDLCQVASDSVDVVVTTAVLCSVNKLDQVLSEILRVLAPGGIYLFVEHVGARDGTWSHVAQQVARPIFHFLFDCDPTRHIARAIRHAGFTDVQITPFVARKLPRWIKLIVGQHIRGMARK